MTLVCAMSSPLTLAATEEFTRTSVLELQPPLLGAENCGRDLFLQIRERLCAFTLLTPPGLQPGLRLGLGFSTSCMPCFWHRLPSAVLRCQQQHPLHVSQTRTRQAFPAASQYLDVPEVRDSRLVPGPIQPQVAHLVCICQLASVRDLTGSCSICSPILVRHSSM